MMASIQLAQSWRKAPKVEMTQFGFKKLAKG